MGIPTSVWFIIAAVALVLGLLMLRASQRTGGAQPRDRRRWAQQKEWEYLDSDPVLPSRWRYGTIHQGGPGVARNLVTGSVPTAEGRRLVYVFDHEQAGRLSSVVAAVQRRSALKGAFELRLPSAPLPDDAGLDLLEPVGKRYAFVSDAAAVRPLITPRLVRAADAIGEDAELLWAEDSWVLCTAPLDYAPEQLQHLIDQLVEVAGSLEEAARAGSSGGRSRAELPAPEPSAEPSPAEPSPAGPSVPSVSGPTLSSVGSSDQRGDPSPAGTESSSDSPADAEPRGSASRDTASRDTGSRDTSSRGTGSDSSAAAGWVRSLSGRTSSPGRSSSAGGSGSRTGAAKADQPDDDQQDSSSGTGSPS